MKTFQETFAVTSLIAEILVTELIAPEKRTSYGSFLAYIEQFDVSDTSTHGGLDPATATTSDLYLRFSLDIEIQDIVGQGIALYTNDE